MRIRQLVIAAADAETANTLRTVLGLGEPYRDPGVGEFGLDNAVFAIGDQFLEVVWPIAETAPAKRFLDRNGGDGGYMAIFETAHMEKVRRTARDAGIRAVWSIDLDDIKATHFHPADVGAAIVSIDQPMPAGEWRWGGPDWRGRSAPGTLAAARLTSPDPAGLADRWGRLLGYGTQETKSGAKLTLEAGELVFDEAPGEELAGFRISVPDRRAVLDRAGQAGLAVADGHVRLGGVELEIVAD
ncbi:MAG: hypothetical protein AAFW65_07315 [Pseudomonadota bacterium]